MTERKDLTYYAISYGGVPMTPQGVVRFVVAAMHAGYTHKEVYDYVPDSLKGLLNKPTEVMQ
jgi:hypothetical protein